MMYFVAKNSIVRKIWGKEDVILFLFAGASAEFALNKAVDWLYFTGKLPADPLGRLFSTVDYAREIIFSENDLALAAIDRITAIHHGVEKKREAQIPDWAYRDVLFMLIDYSIRSYELLENKLTKAEKAEVFDVFYRFGLRMKISGLPSNFEEWQYMRKRQLNEDLILSEFSLDLYRQYQKHLGAVRFLILKQAQVLLVPKKVNQLLMLNTISWLKPILYCYKLIRTLKLVKILTDAIIPSGYEHQVKNLNARC